MKTILFAVHRSRFQLSRNNTHRQSQLASELAVWYSTDMATEYLTAEAHWSTDKIRNRTEIAKAPISEVIARHMRCSIARRRMNKNQAGTTRPECFTPRFIPIAMLSLLADITCGISFEKKTQKESAGMLGAKEEK